MGKIILSLITALLITITTPAYPQDVKTYIHPRALALMPDIKREVARFAPEIPYPWYFPALIDHESCISFKHSKCWSPEAELKNDREQGTGIFQLTRAWDAKGVLRFDNVTTLANKYKTHLAGLNWNTIKQRPDLQLRAGIFLYMEEYNAYPAVEHGIERMRFADSAFNGGRSAVVKSRQVCALTKNCDPKVWFGNVEKYLNKSKTPDKRYGGQSMFSINVKHVADVTVTRMPKFKQFWPEYP